MFHCILALVGTFRLPLCLRNCFRVLNNTGPMFKDFLGCIRWRWLLIVPKVWCHPSTRTGWNGNSLHNIICYYTIESLLIVFVLVFVPVLFPPFLLFCSCFLLCFCFDFFVRIVGSSLAGTSPEPIVGVGVIFVLYLSQKALYLLVQFISKIQNILDRSKSCWYQVSCLIQVVNRFYRIQCVLGLLVLVLLTSTCVVSERKYGWYNVSFGLSL